MQSSAAESICTSISSACFTARSIPFSPAENYTKLNPKKEIEQHLPNEE